MKKITRRETILITLGIFLAFSPIMVNTNLKLYRGYSDNINSDNKHMKISTISDKIHIIGNSGWIAFRNDGNCTGNGTYSDPYVIEDLVIDGGGLGSCILIENSDVYFRIENCTVYNSGFVGYGAGIKLMLVTHSYIIDNNCSNNGGRGIYLDQSDFNILSGNIVNGNDWGGIYLESYCDYNNISGNTVNYNYLGISLGGYGYCYNNNVSGNIVIDNPVGGISLSGSNNTLSGNIAREGICGISLWGGNDNAVLANTAVYNDVGIWLIGSSDTLVSENNASYNDYGLRLYGSNDNMVSGNTASYNQYGIWLESSNYTTVSGNLLMENDVCINEINCEGNVFKNNEYCDYGESGGRILGYNLFFLLGILSAVAAIMIKKLKNH